VSFHRLHRLLICVYLGLALATALGACSAAAAPQLKVVGVEQTRRARPARSVVLFVEVANPAARPMRLQKLQYEFGAAGTRESRGEVTLSRTVEAGAAIIVEVPVLVGAAALAPGEVLTLRGKLYAELDRMVRTFTVFAQVKAPSDVGDARDAGGRLAPATAPPADDDVDDEGNDPDPTQRVSE